MKVLEIKDIVRKNVPIYYRMFYSGTARLELVNITVEHQIDFSVEMLPTGDKKVLITTPEKTIDYPLLPVLQELKAAIIALDADGKLPL
jgi:hypothetical protein